MRERYVATTTPHYLPTNEREGSVLTGRFLAHTSGLRRERDFFTAGKRTRSAICTGSQRPDAQQTAAMARRD